MDNVNQLKNFETLKCLGLNTWLQSQIDFSKLSNHELARVTSVHKESYKISNGNGDIIAELTGKLLYTTNSVIDLPTTGDWVYVDFYDNNSHAIIHDVVSRKTVLKRKASGNSVDYQLIAANIDVAFIVQSLDYNFNLRRLERYLVMIIDSNIAPIILLSKSDLCSESEIGEIVESVKSITADTTILIFSNQDKGTIKEISEIITAGNTYCLLGSSGVGKTSLLNNIIGKDLFNTKTVSKKDNKGRHTTSSRELIQLDNGALLIDTPGMRELGNIAVDTGIDETFSEIITLASQCKFSNCKHTSEKGCAIQTAIKEGELSEKRYQSYIKMVNESNFNDMSYYEKRQKDKNTGKMIKSILKNRKVKKS